VRLSLHERDAVCLTLGDRGGVTGRVIGLVYQLHAIIAWVFWAFFPFSRLVHAWNISPQHLGRPYSSTDAPPLPRAG
jgi:nitrate reductase gamma subunit